MKLRLEDNTLRLRLSSEEVEAFQQEGRLETVVPLGPSVSDRLVYALQRDETATDSALGISYTAGRVVVRLPPSVADTWTSSEEVSLRGTVAVADNQVVHILVEKDLGCKH
ncbi:hypothetical protein MTX78_00320 [Hymenobacter tibetensis]|uniref:Uncharacterized protein n=1 Tax=Hymenobacter tibetensis TaxID=497967 RepID=A0ABY4CYG6_9BACT|nr:hypothetical protein [Hymenobacter tibetensis]UOG75062.1 hypothetical protein MTX78_00320 [Hymenobacter tibetensis]